MKRLLMIVGLFTIMVFVAVPMMAQGKVEVPQIQTGTFSSTGSNLANGSGDRQMTVAVNFPKGFAAKPQVMVSLTAIDAAGGALRVNVVAEGISRDGFSAVVKTWGDSKINSVAGNWVAIAPMTAKVK
jgi:hypothetical protein